MRLVVLGGLVATMVAGAALAGTGDGQERRQAIQLDGALAELTNGDSQHVVLPVLVGDTQYFVVMVYLWRNGQPLAVATPMAAGGQEIPEGSALYRSVMEAFAGLTTRAQGYMGERAGSGTGTGTSDIGGTGDSGGGLFGVGGTGSTGGSNGPVVGTGGTGGTGVPATGTGASPSRPLSRYPHEVKDNGDGTITVKVTMPATQRRMFAMEMRNVAAQTQARETSPGTWTVSANVRTVFRNGEQWRGAESNPDGTVTVWETFEVTPQ